MFATIAARYDLLNHLLSGNIDKRWRRLVAKILYQGLPLESRILDVACGTGDLSLTLSESGEARIVGLDFCRPMLDIAAAKSLKRGAKVPFIEGDALALPFQDRSFDSVTIAFGLRNLASVESGLCELLRVLRPGGRVAVLEFSKPRYAIFRGLFKVYFTKLLPFVGGLISGSRGAYQYLPDSVSRFPDQKELASLMKNAGFEEVTYQNLTGGIAALHLGRRPH
ncbi:MAG: bifunctional demethylmenaquinone methyltransferase/2-methoxy-6-polyprenyl-1,4-benzoquinol methylase UbiE [Pyrinomonadaceae bacterium]|nr:bifunctional demethylmenaquinone methyltransferase/2-methoxy-6-polyprenyl-1,4-benzoquinol methylase UbiE [Pyrinomonadaceae bacterium]